MNPESQIFALLNRYDQKRCTELLYKNKLLADGEVVKVHKKITAITLVSYLATLDLDLRTSTAIAGRQQLFLKLSKPQIQSIDNRREVDFYTTIVPHMPRSPAPHCLEAVYDPEHNLSVIVLAYLGPTHADLHANYPLAPTLDECRQVVQKLAAFHAFWWEKAALQQYAPVGGAVSAAEIGQMYEAFAQRMATWFGGHQRELYDRALVALQTLLNSQGEQRRTLIHGDAHFGNVLYPRSERDEIVFVDWSDWTVGSPMEDIAYMLALRYFPDQRRTLERDLIAWHQHELARHAIDYPLDDSLQDYRRAVVKTLFVPIYQWYHNLPAEVWYYNYERIVAACTDLECMELM